MSTREQEKIERETKKNENKKKDKALLSGRCNADTDETADKKKIFFQGKTI